MISWFSSSLIEKHCCIYHSDETDISYLEYYIDLDLHQIDVLFHDDIKSTNVNN